MLPPIQSPAVIGKKDIPVMCSSCHRDVYDKYTQSIHWSAIEKGITAAPVCTDCHGTHGILKITNPGAKVYPENIPKTCSSCHDSVKLAQQYNLPLNRLTTYENSFHGIALKFGDLRAAFHKIRCRIWMALTARLCKVCLVDRRARIARWEYLMGAVAARAVRRA